MCDAAYFLRTPASGSNDPEADGAGAGCAPGCAAGAADSGAVAGGAADGTEDATGVGRFSVVSTVWPPPIFTASAASTMLSTTKRPASTWVARVRKSAAPRADMKPVGL